MGLRERVVCQFGNPSGALGLVAGFIMFHRSSNLERIRWAVSLLNVQPKDCVLEIGFGPGIAIGMLGELTAGGQVYGIDHSQLMFEQASQRNRDFIQTGRVSLMVGSASRLPRFDRKLDKVLDINTFQFWDDPLTALKGVREQLQPCGIVAIAHQPRNKGATDDDTIKAGERISQRLVASGFQEVRVELRRMNPVSAVCVIGKNPT
jgi:ubiquinone/menaquinone biosynthesis C-methylase UbiE